LTGETATICFLVAILGPPPWFTTLPVIAQLAKSRLRAYAGNNVPLRFLVACDVLIAAAK